MLSENPIELGEAVESTGGADLRNGDPGVDKHGLYIAHTGHLDVVGYGKSGYLLESVGKVAGTDAEMPGEKIEGQILGVMGMNIAGNRIYFLFQLRQIGFVGVNIASLVEKEQNQKFDKLLVNDQIPHGILFRCKLINVIEFSVEAFLQLRIKPKYWDLAVENIQQLLILVGKSGGVGRHIELNDQPFTGLSCGILGPVKPVWGNAHNIKSPNLVRNAFNEVDGIGAKQNA